MDSGPQTGPADLDVDQLFANQQPGFLDNVNHLLTHPATQFLLPVAAGVATGFGRYGCGTGYSVGKGIETGLETATALGGLADKQQKEQRQRKAIGSLFSKGGPYAPEETTEQPVGYIPSDISPERQEAIRKGYERIVKSRGRQLAGTTSTPGADTTVEVTTGIPEDRRRLLETYAFLDPKQFLQNQINSGKYTHFVERPDGIYGITSQGKAEKLPGVPGQPSATVQIPATLQRSLAAGDFDGAISALGQITDPKQYEFASRQIETALNRAALQAQHANDKAQQERLAQQSLDLRREIAQGNQSLRREMIDIRQADQAAKNNKFGGAKPVALQDRQTGQIKLNFTNDDAENGDKFIRLSEKDREELRKLQSPVIHINEMNKYVGDAMLQSGIAPMAFLNAQLGSLRNNPAYRVLHQTLKPLTALAESGVFGQGTRAYRMVRDLQESLNTDTGTVASILEQEKATLEIVRGMMDSGGYSTAAADASLKNISAMQQSKPNSTPGERTVKMRAPDGSTRDVPVSRMEEFRRKGASVVPQ